MAISVDKRYLGLLVLVSVAAASVWLQRSTEPGAQHMAGAEKAPDYYLEGFVAKTMDVEGRLSQQLEAKSMLHFEGENAAELVAPNFTNYRPDGQVWTIKSETATAYQDQDLLLLRGAVLIRRQPLAEDGPVDINTRELKVYQTSELAETSEAVEIRDARGVTWGEGMKVDMQAGHLQLLSKVRGEYVVERH
ncbi:MAG: LPS export ABC transporter periplasmic protein LptC [Gammaproteobacteria bacterium]|nr:LPS export ABC transporter periplasmic protein LptC [Gammaproteobacteria bacterium]